jgi:hypothetical protein
MKDKKVKMTVDQLVPNIEEALNYVRANTDKLGITLTKADVELSANGIWEGGVGVKFDFFVPVDLGGSKGWSRGQTLSLSLTPKGGPVSLGTPESDDLAAGILALAAAIRGNSLSKFAVTDGSVTIDFGVTSEGKLKVIAGGGRKSAGAHRIKLSFRPT